MRGYVAGMSQKRTSFQRLFGALGQLEESKSDESFEALLVQHWHDPGEKSKKTWSQKMMWDLIGIWRSRTWWSREKSGKIHWREKIKTNFEIQNFWAFFCLYLHSDTTFKPRESPCRSRSQATIPRRTTQEIGDRKGCKYYGAKTSIEMWRRKKSKRFRFTVIPPSSLDSNPAFRLPVSVQHCQLAWPREYRRRIKNGDRIEWWQNWGGDKSIELLGNDQDFRPNLNVQHCFVMVTEWRKTRSSKSNLERNKEELQPTMAAKWQKSSNWSLVFNDFLWGLARSKTAFRAIFRWMNFV